MKIKRGSFLIILIITIRAGFGQDVQKKIEYPNLVKNGDFESGAMGFKSDFIYTDTSFNPGYYIIAENINHGSDFVNPIPKTGKYYAINVNKSGNQRLWYDSITVKPNTTYSFSCIAANIKADFENPGVMSLKVNGKMISPYQTLSNGSPEWYHYSIIYKTGPKETRIEISIVDEIWQPLMGNDVALDNIVFKEVPPEVIHKNKGTNDKIKIIEFKFEHSRRITNYQISIRIIKQMTGQVRAYVNSVPMNNDEKWKGSKIDTSFIIGKEVFVDLANEVLILNKIDVTSSSIQGVDGTTCTIGYGTYSGSVSYEFWSPDYETEQRGLTDFLNLCKKIIEIGGLNPKEIL
jgi:hypothetical protein